MAQRVHFSAQQTIKELTMDKWRCIPCDYLYDPAEGDAEGGIAPGTPFEDLPDDWQCPICGVGKEDFEIDI
jgi:rubredoxin